MGCGCVRVPGVSVRVGVLPVGEEGRSRSEDLIGVESAGTRRKWKLGGRRFRGRKVGPTTGWIGGSRSQMGGEVTSGRRTG